MSKNTLRVLQSSDRRFEVGSPPLTSPGDALVDYVCPLVVENLYTTHADAAVLAWDSLTTHLTTLETIVAVFIKPYDGNPLRAEQTRHPIPAALLEPDDEP